MNLTQAQFALQTSLYPPDIDILIGILSMPSNLVRQDAIRVTWGQVVNNVTSWPGRHHEGRVYLYFELHKGHKYLSLALNTLSDTVMISIPKFCDKKKIKCLQISI